jgi:hypothetical protein
MGDLKKITGKCYTFRGLKFYAENGFVCLHDENSGEFFVLTRREFLQRAQALSEEAQRMRTASAQNPDKKWISADRMELVQAIENMIACTYEAKEQGDRTDPKVDEWFLRHRPRRKSRISLASSADFTTGLPGTLPLGRDTGKHVAPDFTMGDAASAPKKLILPGE